MSKKSYCPWCWCWGNGKVTHKPYPSTPHRRTDVKGTSPLLPPLPPSPQIMDSPLSTTLSHPCNQVQDNCTPCVFIVPQLRTSSSSTSAPPSSLASATPSISTISLRSDGHPPKKSISTCATMKKRATSYSRSHNKFTKPSIPPYSQDIPFSIHPSLFMARWPLRNSESRLPVRLHYTSTCIQYDICIPHSILINQPHLTPSIPHSFGLSPTIIKKYVLPTVATSNHAFHHPRLTNCANYVKIHEETVRLTAVKSTVPSPLF